MLFSVEAAPIYLPISSAGRFSFLHTLSDIHCLWIFWWWPLWRCLLALCKFSLFLGEMSIFDWVVCFCDAELEEKHSFQVILDISVSVLTTYTEVILCFFTCPARLPVSRSPWRLTLEGRGTVQVIPVADDPCWGSGKGCSFWLLRLCFLLSSTTPPSGPASVQKLRLSHVCCRREGGRNVFWFWFLLPLHFAEKFSGLCNQDSLISQILDEDYIDGQAR